jgi:hypothetical protein
LAIGGWLVGQSLYTLPFLSALYSMLFALCSLPSACIVGVERKVVGGWSLVFGFFLAFYCSFCGIALLRICLIYFIDFINSSIQTILATQQF